MRFYHGTNREASKEILSKGFSNNKNKKKVWTCSFTEYTYIWKYDAEEINDRTDLWDPLKEPLDDLGFYRAFESAVIGAAVIDSMCRDIIIFGFDIPEDLIMNETVSDDVSCENMEGAFQIRSEDLDRLIKEGVIGLHVYQITNGYKPFMRWFYLLNICEDYISLQKDDYDDFVFFKSCGQCNDNNFELLFSDPLEEYKEIYLN